jgi:hypothetical protein
MPELPPATEGPDLKAFEKVRAMVNPLVDRT